MKIEVLRLIVPIESLVLKIATPMTTKKDMRATKAGKYFVVLSAARASDAWKIVFQTCVFLEFVFKISLC